MPNKDPEKNPSDFDGSNINFSSVDWLVAFYFQEIIEFCRKTLARSQLFYNFLLVIMIVGPLLFMSIIVKNYVSIKINEHNQAKIAESIRQRRPDEEQ